MSVLINPYAFQPVLPAATREYVALKSGSDGTTLTPTVTGCNIGAAAVGRYVFALFMFGAAIGRTVASATIGGVAAKVHAQKNNAQGYYVVLLSAPLSAGATADVAVTLNTSGSVVLIRCATYRVLGLQSDTPVDTVATAGGSAKNNNNTVDVTEDGFVIAGVAAYTGDSNLVWTGFGEDFETTFTGNGQFTGASAEIAATASGFAFSTQSSSVNHTPATVAGSFR